ncbi:MAG TPA: FlgD immunoglobulin-like domain containing protein [Thermoleophilia bacterium]|nr:FlgD immunoglobulin-like domain containing protein [Thermoleophilia bacterium]
MLPNEGMRGEGSPRQAWRNGRDHTRASRFARLGLFSVLAVTAGFCVVWSAPRVSASASSWMAAPPTKARLVAVPLPSVGGGASGAVQLRSNGGAVRAASPRAIDAGMRFNMLGVLLMSRPAYDPGLDVRVRTSLDGVTWSGWTRLDFERNQGPPGSAFDRGDTVSEPLWVGEARYLQYTVGLTGAGAPSVDVSNVRFSFINTLGDADASDVLVSTVRRGLSCVAGIGRVPQALSLASRPPIVTRARWGADESLRSGTPSYATLRMAFVHHTAGSNSYSRAEAPAVVRGIYYFHARTRGWSDIGYNFLIDRFGTIYEGRYGGVTRGVIGAQAGGFNTHSTGISVMGNFTQAPPPGAVIYSLEKLLAWRLDVAHVDPLGRARMTCAVSDRYTAGQVVTFRTIAGHRDANYTTCPGDPFYALLPEIRAAVAQTGQPKIYAPSSSRTALSPDGNGVGDTVTLQAVLSEPADWTITARDASGNVVRELSGQGSAIEAVWDGLDAGGTRVADGPYDAVMVGTNAHGVTRSAAVRVAVDTVRPTVGDVGAARAVSPNGDGIADSAAIAFTVSEAGRVRVQLFNAGGALVRTLQSALWVSSGPNTVAWDGKVASPSGLVPAASGTYMVLVRATDAAGNVGNGSGAAKVNLTLGFPKASPLHFSPNGDGVLDTSRLGFKLARAASVRVAVKGSAGTVRTFSLGTLQPGSAGAVWKGDAGDVAAANGAYSFTVTATNSLGTISVKGPVYLDRYVPRPRVPADTTVRYGNAIAYVYSVRDPATRTVHVRVEVRNGRGTLLAKLVPGWVTAGVQHKITYRPQARRTYVFTLFARDHAGNVAAPVKTTIKVR